MIRKFISHLVLFGIGCFLTVASVAAEEPEITIKKISVDLRPAPRYELQRSVPETDSSLKWLVVEAELDCQPEWADEVTLRFYVVANYGPGVKGDFVPQGRFDLLAATVTVVNMRRNVGTGRKNIVPVFLNSRSVKKYGALSKSQFIEQVAVQVMYKGKVQDTQWMTTARQGERFWEAMPPKNGILVNLLQTPWWPAYGDFYEQVKTAPSASLNYQ
jgi:ribosome biogenesis SPOUT family RNA methylase Rps3